MIINTKMYAQALFLANQDKGIEYLNELERISEILTDVEVRQFFISSYDHFDMAKEVLADHFSAEIINFIHILYDNKMMAQFDNLIKNYQIILSQHKVISLVIITSPTALQSKAKEELVSMIKTRYQRPLHIEYQVDKSLIGGIVVSVDGDIYDTSIKNRLSKFVNKEVAYE